MRLFVLVSLPPGLDWEMPGRLAQHTSGCDPESSDWVKTLIHRQIHLERFLGGSGRPPWL